MSKKILSFVLGSSFLYLLFYFLPIYDGNSQAIFNNSDKLWVHRVLDYNDVNTKCTDFKGVEVDVFFEEGKKVFDVRHHGNYQGNSLLNYLQNINNNELYFWIDLKNLNKKNVFTVVERLNKLIENGVRKEHLIIESKNIELLVLLQSEGFYVSYWLPSFNLFRSIYEVYQVKGNLKKYKPNAISCSYHNVDFYSRKFPNYNLHCWTNGLKEGEDDYIVKKLSLRNNVKVILVDFENNFLK
jgi:hypothetical protein